MTHPVPHVPLRDRRLLSWVSCFALGGLALLATACQRTDKTKTSGPLRIGGRTIGEPAAPVPPRPAPPPLTELARYQQVLRPILIRSGCAAGPCHSAFRGGGFFFTGGDDRELHEVVTRIDRSAPEKSEILRKATNQLQHNGGRNLDVGSCGYRRIVAWIAGQPDIDCSAEAPRSPARFAREAAPALVSMGCVSCHSEPGAAKSKLDLTELTGATQNPDVVLARIEAAKPSRFQPWATALIAATDATDGKHSKAHDHQSCAFRRLYGFLADAPELSCALSEPAAPTKLPSFADFVTHVEPAIAKRGCFDVSCHSGGVEEMSLHGVSDRAYHGWHDYLMLIARVPDLTKPDDSLFLRTVRNQEPHGGGQRLGGAGDCIDDTVTAWLRGQPIAPCKKPKVPSFARFVQEIQPVLDTMTCTKSRCHGANLEHFKVKRAPTDQASLRKNYDVVLAHVNLDFMPFSEVQLRMRQPCAYSIVGAWIEGKPSPVCTVVTPPASIFPRMGNDEAEISSHKLPPDPPAATPPAP